MSSVKHKRVEYARLSGVLGPRVRSASHERRYVRNGSEADAGGLFLAFPPNIESKGCFC